MEGILACGSDGEKALIEGFQRNLRFAVFLRCFLLFKDNIKRELTKRGITAEAKKQFSDEIFGIQDGTTKYTLLVDCNSDEEFDSKLAALKANWEEREVLNGSHQKKKTFFDWFLCRAVERGGYPGLLPQGPGQKGARTQTVTNLQVLQGMK